MLDDATMTICNGDELITLRIVPGFPCDRSGKHCRCYYDREAHEIYVTDTLPLGQRTRLIAMALDKDPDATAWSLVPIPKRAALVG